MLLRSNFITFYTALLLPSSITSDETFPIQYIIYTTNPDLGISVQPYSYCTLTSPINNTAKINILYHGYNSNSSSPFYPISIAGYVSIGEVVIALDYGPAVADIFYFPDMRNAPGLGKQIGDFLLNFMAKFNVPLENFHLIGHSLGAHIAAFTGQFIQKSLNASLSRITGLDPAGPGYLDLPPEERLSEDDALFVDVIHTNGGEAGYFPQLGHVDFYPNGGKYQYGCGLNLLDGCSHGRSALYFAESITNNRFFARACENYFQYKLGFCQNNTVQMMGEFVDVTTASGTYYLDTNTESPFALG